MIIRLKEKQNNSEHLKDVWDSYRTVIELKPFYLSIEQEVHHISPSYWRPTSSQLSIGLTWKFWQLIGFDTWNKEYWYKFQFLFFFMIRA